MVQPWDCSPTKDETDTAVWQMIASPGEGWKLGETVFHLWREQECPIEEAEKYRGCGDYFSRKKIGHMHDSPLQGTRDLQTLAWIYSCVDDGNTPPANWSVHWLQQNHS